MFSRPVFTWIGLTNLVDTFPFVCNVDLSKFSRWETAWRKKQKQKKTSPDNRRKKRKMLAETSADKIPSIMFVNNSLFSATK